MTLFKLQFKKLFLPFSHIFLFNKKKNNENEKPTQENLPHVTNKHKK